MSSKTIKLNSEYDNAILKAQQSSNELKNLIQLQSYLANQTGGNSLTQKKQHMLQNLFEIDFYYSRLLESISALADPNNLHIEPEEITNSIKQIKNPPLEVKKAIASLQKNNFTQHIIKNLLYSFAAMATIIGCVFLAYNYSKRGNPFRFFNTTADLGIRVKKDAEAIVKTHEKLAKHFSSQSPQTFSPY